jgi:hypothetical protein
MSQKAEVAVPASKAFQFLLSLFSSYCTVYIYCIVHPPIQWLGNMHIATVKNPLIVFQSRTINSWNYTSWFCKRCRAYTLAGLCIVKCKSIYLHIPSCLFPSLALHLCLSPMTCKKGENISNKKQQKGSYYRFEPLFSSGLLSRGTVPSRI